MAQQTPDEIFERKIAALMAAEDQMKIGVARHQRKLFALVVNDFLPLFDVKAGLLLDTPHNIRLVSAIDRIFDSMDTRLYNSVLGPFVAGVLEATRASAEYYVAMGFGQKKVASLIDDRVNMERRIGLKPNGKLLKSGYLYRLGQTAPVRQQLKDYVTKNLTGDVSYTDFLAGFRTLIKGGKNRQGLAVNGALENYYQQYAYDKFNELDATANRVMARELELRHFVYVGSIIDTTRAFCAKRAGKAFSVEDARTWVNDPDLIDPKTAAAYRPLIDRGRYNCRHFLKYITESTYNIMKKREK